MLRTGWIDKTCPMYNVYIYMNPTHHEYESPDTIGTTITLAVTEKGKHTRRTRKDDAIMVQC